MRRTILAAAALSGTLASAAHSEELLFSLTGHDSISFFLSSTPTLISSDDPFNIYVGPVDASVDGKPVVFSEIGFGTIVYAPSLLLDDEFGYYGPLLFTGPKTNPVFTPETVKFDSGFNGDETLVISDASAAPEPSTWGLLTVGIWAVGYALRRMRATLGLKHARP